jgi:hypothetical protein
MRQRFGLWQRSTLLVLKAVVVSLSEVTSVVRGRMIVTRRLERDRAGLRWIRLPCGYLPRVSRV